MNLNKKGVKDVSLSDVPVGFEATIISVPNDSVGNRLLSIGFVPGSKIKVIMSAPLGDPRTYLVMGKMITLRNDEAKRITVTLENGIELLSDVTEGTWKIIHLFGGLHFQTKLRMMGIEPGKIVSVLSKGLVKTEKGVFKIGSGMARRILVRRDEA
ncbi:FeoA family protein [Thermotoga caldifontis]|uniref:FeoA family protein n=1 Tax=Thermotoga caldifontis TaxID=1508419 RepID=UPI00069363EE|nr:FeoA family protein [Thermotoga caldifontis]